MLMGADAVAALANGVVVDVPAWKVGLMMGSATPINLLLLFVPMLLILKHRSIPASFKNSIAVVVGAYKPMLIIGAMIFLTVALAPSGQNHT
jgi:hypothetical protein